MTTSALTVKYLRGMKSKERFKVFCIIREGAPEDASAFFPAEDLFAVESFEDGNVRLFLTGKENVDQVIDIALGLMAKGSNFEEELNKAFFLETMDEIKSISFEFMGEIVRVNSADKKEMVLERELAPILKN